MEINFKDYLSEEEVKDILKEELRGQVRKHFNNEENARRLLSNLAYAMVMVEVDKIVPNYHTELVNKVAELITNKDLSFHVFNTDYISGSPKSLGAKIVDQTVKENTQLIKDKVVDAIQKRDYTEESLIKLEQLSEDFTSNIYEFINLVRK